MAAHQQECETTWRNNGPVIKFSRCLFDYKKKSAAADMEHFMVLRANYVVVMSG
jgi:hypothetical protein